MCVLYIVVFAVIHCLCFMCTPWIALLGFNTTFYTLLLYLLNSFTLHRP